MSSNLDTEHDLVSGGLRSLTRWQALIAALRDGPLPRPTLIQRLGAAYPPEPSARPMIDRDLARLRAIGITITKTRTRPPVYTLHGGVPHFSTEQLRAVALVRDTFSARHPQAATIAALLEQLTAELTPAERAVYAAHQTQRVPLDPAIDYTPYSALIERLSQAVAARQLLSFHYHATDQSVPTRHTAVEPVDLEFRDRHFYFIGYVPRSQQQLDFRVDRIEAESVQGGNRLPPGAARPATPIQFRYRLAAKLARGAISERFANQRVVERLASGDVIIEAEGRSPFLIIQTLMRYGDRAELLSPPELRAQMAAEVQRLAAMYAVE